MDLDPAANTHQELIRGFTELFGLLVKMRYISPQDVSYPPHRSPPVDVEHLRRLGLDEDTIAAAQVIPQLRHKVVWGWQKEGVDLAPNSKALNFLAVTENGRELQDDLWKGSLSYLDEAGQLPPWVLPITSGAPTSSGAHLLLDARKGTIIQYQGPRNSGRIAKDWQTMPAHPIETVLSEMVARIRGLVWVPIVDGGNNQESRRRRLIVSPTVDLQISQTQNPRRFHYEGPSRAEDQAALRQVQNKTQQQQGSGGEDYEAWFFQNEVNYYHAFRKLYLDCGWDVEKEDGGPHFDGDRLEQLRDEFARRVKALRGPAIKAAGERQRIEQSAQAFADLPSNLRQMGLQQLPDGEDLRAFRPEVMDRYSNFLRESAGDRSL